MLRIQIMGLVVFAGSALPTLYADPPTETESSAPKVELHSANKLNSNGTSKIHEKLNRLNQQFYKSLISYTPLPLDSITIHSRTGISIEFVYIPPGQYFVGREISRIEKFFRMTGQQAGPLDEGGKHQVTFKKGFYLARRKVTAGQFVIFLNAVKADVASKSVVLNSFSNLQLDEKGTYSVKPGAERFPASTVTWEGATAFNDWLKEQSGWDLRLPTEDEWEAATRTTQGFLGPSGGPPPPQDPDTGLLAGIRLEKGDVEVDAYPENMTINGLYHTVGWVGEWTMDIYKFDRIDKKSGIEDILLAKTEGCHTVKGRGRNLTSRLSLSEVGEYGICGFRILLEANKDASPLRHLPIKQNEEAPQK